MEEKPNDSSSKTLESAFNFGPGLASNRSVKDLVEESLKHWPGSWIDKSTTNSVHEASLLNLATDKAYHILKWKPRWSFEQTVKQTLDWYKEFRDQNDTEKLRRFTINQIHQYEASI
jgi:CDP-glucose 4,6-dehydratase